MLASSSDEEEADDVVGGDEHTQELLTIYKRGEQLPSNISLRGTLANSPSVSPSLHSPSLTFSVCKKLPCRNNKKMTKGKRDYRCMCSFCGV